MSRLLTRATAAALATAALIAIGLLYAYPLAGGPGSVQDFTAPFFRRLESVRADREGQVVAYFDAARRLAEGIVETF